MSFKTDPIKIIDVHVFIREGCHFSARILDELHGICKELPIINLSIKDVTEVQQEKPMSGGITPSIWVNGELWFLGISIQICFRKRST